MKQGRGGEQPAGVTGSEPEGRVDFVPPGKRTSITDRKVTIAL